MRNILSGMFGGPSVAKMYERGGSEAVSHALRTGRARTRRRVVAFLAELTAEAIGSGNSALVPEPPRHTEQVAEPVDRSSLSHVDLTSHALALIVLMEALGDADAVVRQQAVSSLTENLQAFGKMDGGVESLRRAIRTEWDRSRYSEPPYLSALFAALDRPHARVRHCVLDCLNMLRDPQSVAGLIAFRIGQLDQTAQARREYEQWMKNPDEPTRYQIGSLSSLAGDAERVRAIFAALGREAIEPLKTIAQSGNVRARSIATTYLQAIDVSDPDSADG